jgi:hypothetical protein
MTLNFNPLFMLVVYRIDRLPPLVNIIAFTMGERSLAAGGFTCLLNEKRSCDR